MRPPRLMAPRGFGLPYGGVDELALRLVKAGFNSLELFDGVTADDLVGEGFAAEEASDVIARFGRYPSRNAALGRDSTPEEAEFLKREGVGW